LVRISPISQSIFPFDPIDRWWGGTHLTNEHLWRYDPVLTKA
jgi:hypothetical protein